jgi:antitoxin VapB
MQTARTKTFMSGNSEAVRLPKGIGFGDNVELEIIRDGDVITLRPAKISMKQMIAELRKLPKPPYVEVRDTEEIPERPGL